MILKQGQLPDMPLLSCEAGLQVDPVRNLLYVRGQVPGHKGNFVMVSDATLTSFRQQPQRPFPTHVGPLPTDVSIAPAPAADPYLN